MGWCYRSCFSKLWIRYFFTRYLLRSSSFSLRFINGSCFWNVCRILLLDWKNFRFTIPRNIRPNSFLVIFCRGKHHILPNAVCSYGSYLSVIGAIFFFYVVYATLTGNERCPKNPWETTPGVSPTLEWLTPSPPAFHTFEEIPTISTPESK